MIINSSSKIICWYTIFLHDDPITVITRLNGNGTSHNVIKMICLIFWHTNSNAWLTSFLPESFFLFLCQITMCTGLFSHVSSLPLSFSFFFRFICGHVALLCYVFFRSVIDVLLV